MNISTNGEYNPIQLNETINLSPDGKVLSKSLMLNLRGESVKKVWESYKKLKSLVDGKEDKPEKKTKKNPGKEKELDEKEQKNDENICPQCGAVLLEKNGISSKNGRPYHFWGCSNFPICNYTKPFLSEAEKNAPCDEDLITIEEQI